LIMSVPDEGLFQKRVVHTNFDIYVLITATRFISTLLDMEIKKNKMNTLDLKINKSTCT